MSTVQPARRLLTAAAVDALVLDAEPWLSCDDCFERADAYVEALLRDGTGSDPAMAAHLRGCPACAEEADTLMALLTDRAVE